MATNGGAPASFRPACIMCVSDCDGSGLFTSCHHFVCARCAAKYPAGSCPRCQKPCQSMRISAPSLATRIGTDGMRGMQQAVQSLEFQRRQDGLTIQRLKELVTLFNGQHRTAAAKVQELSGQLQAAGEENAQLRQALQEARQQQQQQQQQLKTLSPSHPSHHQHQHQQHHTQHHGYGGSPYHDYGAGGRSPPPRGIDPDARNDWASSRAPSRAGSDIASLFGAKRGRGPPTPAPNGQHGSESPDMRFALATPAVTLRQAAPLEQHRAPPQPRPGTAGGTATGRGNLPALRSLLPQSRQNPGCPSTGASAPFLAPT